MALIDVTPIMTSNTEPAPYKVSGSSGYNGDGTSLEWGWSVCFNPNLNRWLSARNSDTNQWIMFDFGEQTKITKATINSNAIHEVDSSCMPKDLMIQGSNDGKVFITLGQMISSSWGLGEEKEINFERMAEYRYYRIFMFSAIGTNASGNRYLRMGNIKFLYDDSFENPKERSSKSSTYQLPMNTTQAILAKSDDDREGLLGMANDSENYGDLYVVGKDGKSHLTKAGMKSETIWSGTVDTVPTTITLQDDKYFKFRYYIFDFGWGGDSSYTSKLITNASNKFTLNGVIFEITNNNSIKVVSGITTANKKALRRIIGIY